MERTTLGSDNPEDWSQYADVMSLTELDPRHDPFRDHATADGDDHIGDGGAHRGNGSAPTD